MSIGVEGYSADYIFVTTTGERGRTDEALRRTLDAMFRDQADPEVVDRLQEVYLDGTDSDIMSRHAENGQHLLGLAASPDANEPLVAVVFIETSPDDLLDNGAFSVLRMAAWMDHLAEPDPEAGGKTVVDQLLDLVLVDVSDAEDGDPDVVVSVPVERDTKVVGFQEGAWEFVIGHRRELAALAELDLPEKLRIMLSTVMRQYHVLEQKSGRAPEWPDMQDALHDLWPSGL